MASKRVVLYARLSVTKEESVSIARQLKACQQYAAARGWTVIGKFVDEGVSATHNKPEDRAGWKDLLTSDERYDAVVVWKVDRLARRVLDFLHADEALQTRGAGLVCVEDPVDMTTAQGRAFATVLAVFGELEAAAISARVKAAREHLIRAGRVVGGTVPYGWRSIENPDGSGFVLAQDPECIGWVRGMAERVLVGETIYAITRWLDAEGAPLPTASQKRRVREGWHYGSVERLLRNPVLAGMTSYQPGRGRHETVDPNAVRRDESGLPVVDESVAILTTDERRTLLALLDDRDSPQSRARADRGVTSPLLSGLATCHHCDRTMYRGTTQGRPSLACPACHQVVSRTQLDAHIEQVLLSVRGDEPVIEAVKVAASGRGSAALADIEEAIKATAAQMTEDDADVAALSTKLANLKEARAAARSDRPSIAQEWVYTGQTVREAWEAAAEDETERRAVLTSQVAGLRIQKGKGGRYLDKTRVLIDWLPDTSTTFPSIMEKLDIA